MEIRRAAEKAKVYKYLNFFWVEKTAEIRKERTQREEIKIKSFLILDVYFIFYVDKVDTF